MKGFSQTVQTGALVEIWYCIYHFLPLLSSLLPFSPLLPYDKGNGELVWLVVTVNHWKMAGDVLPPSNPSNPTNPVLGPQGLGNGALFSCSDVTSQPLCSCCMLYNSVFTATSQLKVSLCQHQKSLSHFINTVFFSFMTLESWI